MYGVMEVVAPLRIEPGPSGGARRHHPGVVEVALRDERQRTAQVCRECRHLQAHLLQQVHGRVVDERVHGIEPQFVDVEVAQPHQCVVEDVAAYLG